MGSHYVYFRSNVKGEGLFPFTDSENYRTVDTWLKDMNIRATVYQASIRFDNDEDATLCHLRWS